MTKAEREMLQRDMAAAHKRALYLKEYGDLNGSEGDVYHRLLGRVDGIKLALGQGKPLPERSGGRG